MIFWMHAFLYFLLLLLLIYFIRHLSFTLNRAFKPQKSIYIGLDDFTLPTVSVLIPAHNEELVIADAIEALLKQDYPESLFKIIPLNDRSTDKTKEIIDGYVKKFPHRVIPYHRNSGKPGKSAALKEVCASLTSDIIIVFDADYIPAPKLLKNLVSPFIDPEVGAVMGRVVPINANRNMLTRILDLERSAGYQVDQQARMNMSLLPQYGGTVGGVRNSALHSVGGWDDEILAEDTDITYRMYIHGWSVVYQNSCECYEEVPEQWEIRKKQIRRWARGHNQVLLKQIKHIFTKSKLPFFNRLDALLLLGVFLMGPILFIGFIVTQLIYYFDRPLTAEIAVNIGAFVIFSTLGNFALFFEIGMAAYLDGYRKRIRLLPLGVGFFFVSLITVTGAFWRQVLEDHILKKEISWDKTVRFRNQENKT